MKSILYVSSGIAIVIFMAFRFAGVDFSKDIEGGIQFHKGNWQEAMALAKKENKIIFLDVYASWCGPCKKMKKNTFSGSKAGSYYNSNFINIAFDAERGEGIEIAEKYKVRAFPSLLFINGNGDVIFRTGGYHNADELVELGKSVLKQ